VADGVLQLDAARYREVVTVDDSSLSEAVRERLAVFVAAGGTWRHGMADLPGRHPALATTTSERFSDVTIRWTPFEPDVNALPLAVTRVDDGWQAAFAMREPVDGSLLFMEPVLQPRLNGQALSLDSVNGLQVAVISGEMLGTDNLLEFRTERQPAGVADPETRDAPFVGLIGDFRVLHDEAGTPLLAEAAPLAGPDLAAGGYAYVHRPVTAAGVFHTHQTYKVDSLQLLHPLGAALRLAIDGVDYGWTWGPDWAVHGLRRVPPGEHDIEISLAPSADHYYAPGQLERDERGLPRFALPTTLRLHPIKGSN
jgi:hypothetical protein